MGSAEPGFLEIRLIGPDPEYLYEQGNRLVDGLRAMPGTLDVRSNWENKILKARIVVDQVRARRAGVTSRDIALWLNAHMDGVEVTEYREGDIAIPVSRAPSRSTAAGSATCGTPRSRPAGPARWCRSRRSPISRWSPTSIASPGTTRNAA